MFKITETSGSTANPKETEGKVGGNSMVSDMISGGEVTKSTNRKNQLKITKSKILVKSKNHNFPKSKTKKTKTGFFILKARLTFTQLRQAFVEASILHHFNLESHIWIEIDESGYAIGGVLSQLSSGTRPDGVVTKADLSQWHPVAFFSREMIPTKTRYKTHNGKLLAIVEVFKT